MVDLGLDEVLVSLFQVVDVVMQLTVGLSELFQGSFVLLTAFSVIVEDVGYDVVAFLFLIMALLNLIGHDVVAYLGKV